VCIVFLIENDADNFFLVKQAKSIHEASTLIFLKKRIVLLLSISCLIISANISSVKAQNDIIKMFGNILGGAVVETTKKEWAKLSPEKLQCMQIGLKIKGAPLENLIKKGIKPSDQRIAAFHKNCDNVLNKKLRTDFQCQLKDKQGNMVNTRCDEYLVIVKNGQISRVNKQQAIVALFNGIQVNTYNNQTQQAAKAIDTKLAVERKKREKAAERKRQEAEAERKKIAAEAERKKIAAEAERKRVVAEVELKRLATLAINTQKTLAERKNCKPKLEAVGFLSGKLNQGDTVKDLSSANTRSNDAYAAAVPYLLAGSGKYAEVEKALSYRVVQDAHIWQQKIARNNFAAVADAEAATSSLRENCYYDLSDYIVSAISISAQKATAFALGKTTTPAGIDLTLVNLIKTVPLQILEQTFNAKTIQFIPGSIEVARRTLAERKQKEREKKALKQAAEEKNQLELEAKRQKEARGKIEKLINSKSGIKKRAGSINISSLLKTDMRDLISHRGIYYKRHSNVPFSGGVKGKVKGTIKDGKKEGPFVYFHSQIKGNISEGNYKDGKREGAWVHYYETGQIDAIGSYKGGKKEGPWIHYRSNTSGFPANGKLWMKGSYIGGVREGRWEGPYICFEGGNPSRNGVDGYCFDDYEDGEIRAGSRKSSGYRFEKLK
jgi:antitoxin component YwqK of YwqJK toxin-antitoxin module